MRIFLLFHLYTLISLIEWLKTVDVIAPTLSYPFITLPICVLIAVNLFGHYYYVITVPPGFIDDGPREPGPNYTATSWLWAKKNSSSGKGRHQRVLTGGLRWSARGVKITPAAQTRCNKCGRMRPEVCVLSHTSGLEMLRSM